MDGRKLARGAGAWLAFAAGTGAALALAWASMRSLYYPGTGESLTFDATLGALLGALLGFGAWRAHQRLREREPDAVGVGPAVGIALAGGVPVALAMGVWADGVANHDSGWFSGIEYLFIFVGGAAAATLLSLGVLLSRRTWRAFLSTVVVTAGAVSVAAVLFAALLVMDAPALQAAAEARNKRVPGTEAALLVAALALLAWARRRPAAPPRR